MNVTFIHTADWQLGKPFAGVEDPQKCSLLQNERFLAIRRIADTAKERRAEFVLVAGDLFDSPSATKATVSATCSAIGAIGLPVYAIPGNHDHGGNGCLWEQEFYRRERNQLAPNFHVLLKAEPVELDKAVLFPCPLLRRHESADPTEWLRSITWDVSRFGDKPRIIIAHGSITNFSGFNDDEESDAGAVNFIDLSRIPEGEFDFLALGDWHGTKQVGPKAWYSGTPELDRFVKGSEHNPGNILVVDAGRGQMPKVECVKTGIVGWHDLAFRLADDSSLETLAQHVADRVGGRANQDLLHLHLEGSLGINASSRLEEMLDSLTARLIRLKFNNQTTLAPNAEELDGLTCRSGDPLVSGVAARLVALAAGNDAEADVARIALRELYVACNSH